jgi:hypothetical protein
VKPFNGEFDAGGPVMTSDDGECAAFMTAEPLAGPQDEDQQSDIYLRCPGTTTLVSGGTYTPPDEEDLPAELDAMNPHARQVVFDSEQTLNYEDRDRGGPDVYEWYYGKTILASEGPGEPYFPPPEKSEFLAFVPIGLGRVFFITAEPLVAEDTDNSPDIYERQLEVPDYLRIYSTVEGTTRLVSLGSKSGSGPFTPSFHAVSADGSRVLFTTAEQLVNSDTDSSVDLYERIGGSATRLVSAGQINGNGAFDVSAQGDGERPLFTTAEQLVPADSDSEPDLYERVSNRTQLLSTAVPDPSAPDLRTNPASPSNVDTPSLTGTADPDSTIEVFTGAGCEGSPTATGTVAELESSGLQVTVPDNTTTEFSARAANEGGTPSPCSSPITYVEDSIPDSIALGGVDPKSPANLDLPRVTGSTEPDATVRLFADGSCQGAVAGTGAGIQLSGPGLRVQVPDNTTTQISAIAVDVAGNPSACSAPLTYTEDSIAPGTKILAGPAGKTTNRTPAFRLHVSEAGAYPICKLDGAPPKRCSLFYRVERLSFGRHRISIAGVDPAGNVDPTPATRSWKVVRARRHHSLRARGGRQ